MDILKKPVNQWSLLRELEEIFDDICCKPEDWFVSKLERDRKNKLKNSKKNQGVKDNR